MYKFWQTYIASDSDLDLSLTQVPFSVTRTWTWVTVTNDSDSDSCRLALGLDLCDVGLDQIYHKSSIFSLPLYIVLKEQRYSQCNAEEMPKYMYMCYVYSLCSWLVSNLLIQMGNQCIGTCALTCTHTWNFVNTSFRALGNRLSFPDTRLVWLMTWTWSLWLGAQTRTQCARLNFYQLIHFQICMLFL